MIPVCRQHLGGGVLRSLASFPKKFVLALLRVEGIGQGLPGLMITVLLVMAAKKQLGCFDVSIKAPLEGWGVAMW